MSAIIDSVKERIYERAKSPFVGAFVISWFFINFRAVYVLLVSDSYVEAFSIIDSKIWRTDFELFIRCIALPCVSAFMYLGIVPVLESWAVYLWARGKIQVRNVRLRVEDGAILDGLMIKQYEEQLSLMTNEHQTALELLSSDLNAKLGEERERANYYRGKVCESIHHAHDAKRILQNMNQFFRDILWITAQLAKTNNALVNSESMLRAMRQFYPEFSLRMLSDHLMWLSKECYIKQEITEIITDVSFSLSDRGADLVKVMRAAGLQPKTKGFLE